MDPLINKLMKKAINAHENGELKLAEQHYNTVLSASPLHPDANHNLGVIKILAHKVTEAIPLFKNAVAAKPTVEQFWLSYMEALLIAGEATKLQRVMLNAKRAGVSKEKLDIVNKKLSQGIRGTFSNYDSPPQQQVDQLLKMYQCGDYHDTATVAQSLVHEYPDYQLGWKILGAALREDGKTKQALEANQKSISLDPNDAEAHFNTGVNFADLNAKEKAVAHYKKAISLRPDYTHALNNLGATLLQQNNIVEAAEVFKKAVELTPEKAELQSNLGITFYKLGDFESARICHEKAITLSPESAIPHNNLGNTLRELGELREAEMEYRTAIRIKSDFAEAMSNLGITLQELGEENGAIAHISNALAINPDYFQAHYNLGNVKKESGFLSEAEQHYTTAIELKSDYAEAYINIGSVQHRLGKLDKAEGSCRVAISLGGSKSEAHSILGEILLEKGSFEEGIREKELGDGAITLKLMQGQDK